MILYNSDQKKKKIHQRTATHRDIEIHGYNSTLTFRLIFTLEDRFWNGTGLNLEIPNFHGLYQTQEIRWAGWIEGQLRFLSWFGFIGKLEMWDRGQRDEVMKAMSQTRIDLINPHRLASHANNLQSISWHEPHITAIGSNPVLFLMHHPSVFKSPAFRDNWHLVSVHLKPVFCFTQFPSEHGIHI